MYGTRHIMNHINIYITTENYGRKLIRFVKNSKKKKNFPTKIDENTKTRGHLPKLNGHNLDIFSSGYFQKKYQPSCDVTAHMKVSMFGYFLFAVRGNLTTKSFVLITVFNETFG